MLKSALDLKELLAFVAIENTTAVSRYGKTQKPSLDKLFGREGKMPK